MVPGAPGAAPALVPALAPIVIVVHSLDMLKHDPATLETASRSTLENTFGPRYSVCVAIWRDTGVAGLALQSWPSGS